MATGVDGNHEEQADDDRQDRDGPAQERSLCREPAEGFSKSLGSSIHVPVAIDGMPGSVNFWSKQTSAFPSDSKDTFRAIGDVIVGANR